jgi:hypothetical protein
MARLLTALLLLQTVAPLGRADEPALDLTRAVVMTPRKLSDREEKAVAMLIDEVEKRTQIRWQRTVKTMPKTADAAILIGRKGAPFPDSVSLPKIPADDDPKPEGFRIGTVRSNQITAVVVIGNDERGVLFGVGYLLRKLELSRQKATLPGGFLDVATSPQTSLRGHQLGYRPKTNSFDGWTLAIWEQYIRDLAVFGTNAIELIPPRSDDAADSPHFPLPPMEMMIGMSRLADQYGLDVWIWYPAMDADYGDPATVTAALKEWGEVFQKLPRIDAVFVPGGDPGHTAPAKLMALLEKQTANLKKHHPRAQMWVSPQGFNRAWMDEFLAIVKTEPAWLGGIVHGPQVRLSLKQLREAVPKKYPIRNYPDITHSLRCQFPVPDWDLAFAQTEGREGINPRPAGMATLFRAGQASSAGFITYSEGCNDDVNKMIWSGLGWDANAEVLAILRDYSRYFIGPAYTDTFAQGLLALERNWQGPVLTNGGIATTLTQFQVMEKNASPQDKLNWRFQQALYRAYYDAYVQCRLLYETQLEDEALAKLREAKMLGAALAMDEAETILDRAVTRRTAGDYRARVFELAEALFQSIRMQLSVERYKAISVGRGANLDTIDAPLNNRLWLKAQFPEIRKLPTESQRLARLDEIVNWTNPGPGGFYDDLGKGAFQPHLVAGAGFVTDPEFRTTPLMHFEERPTARRAWLDQALTLFDAPLKLRYTGLDPAAAYKVKAVYGGGPIRLVANDKVEVHAALTKTYEPVEFDIPQEATRAGELTLTWTRTPGGGGAGRGCQVAEVWLMRKRESVER